MTAKHLNVKQIAFVLTVMSWGTICTEEEFVLNLYYILQRNDTHLIIKMSEAYLLNL